jgi:DNA helicase-2/ATP-dependent DNA helicase PcrA
MVKRVIFAVAGSGKTTHIINQLNESSRSLIITFTNNNYANLRKKVMGKYGYLPNNIKIFTYFTFLHSFCYKPFLLFKYRTKGIEYHPNQNYYARGKDRFITKYNRLYYNRISKILDEDGVLENVNQRLAKYFDNLFVDEVQDFAGNDFNFLNSISKAKLNMLFLGDFYQHTYDTSNDGRVNFSLHDNYDKYKKRFGEMGIEIDTTSLNSSHRCSSSVCDYITDNVGIVINSHRTDQTVVKYIVDMEEGTDIIRSNDVVKLFWQKHYNYNCFSSNWGESKGTDHYNDVCVVLYKSIMKPFQNGELKTLSQRIKNKLYVACTRARGNLYFIEEERFFN